MEVSIGDGIAAAALALSLYTIWRQSKQDRQNQRLNALLIKKEEIDNLAALRADISANFVKIGRNDYRFRVYNRGKGTARNVRMEIVVGQELLDTDLNHKFPFPLLDTHQSIDMLARVHMGSPRRATVRLAWEDDAGGGEKEITDDVF